MERAADAAAAQAHRLRQKQEREDEKMRWKLEVELDEQLRCEAFIEYLRQGGLVDTIDTSVHSEATVHASYTMVLRKQAELGARTWPLQRVAGALAAYMAGERVKVVRADMCLLLYLVTDAKEERTRPAHGGGHCEEAKAAGR
jgi:hypothetical protein